MQSHTNHSSENFGKLKISKYAAYNGQEKVNGQEILAEHGAREGS
jgi:hypothetical protein